MFSFPVIGLFLAFSTGFLAIEYSYFAFFAWGEPFSVIHDTSWLFGESIHNLGMSYVGDAMIWWGDCFFIGFVSVRVLVRRLLSKEFTEGWFI